MKRRPKRRQARPIARKKQIGHSAQGHPDHAKDAAEYEYLKHVHTVRLPWERPDGLEVDLSAIPPRNYVFEGGEMIEISDPIEYATRVQQKASKLTTYRLMRDDDTPRIEHTSKPLLKVLLTLPPWFSLYLSDRVKLGDDPRALSNLMVQVLAVGLDEAARLTGYRKVSLTSHTDTRSGHGEPNLTRYLPADPDPQPPCAGTVLGLVGLHAVGVDRQIRVGANVAPASLAHYESNLAKYRDRHGETALPTDIAVARAIDDRVDRLLKDDITPYKRAYVRWHGEQTQRAMENTMVHQRDRADRLASENAALSQSLLEAKKERDAAHEASKRLSEHLAEAADRADAAVRIADSLARELHQSRTEVGSLREENKRIQVERDLAEKMAEKATQAQLAAEAEAKDLRAQLARAPSEESPAQPPVPSLDDLLGSLDTSEARAQEALRKRADAKKHRPDV